MEAKNKTHKHDESLFDSWSEKSAYLLGYLEADGCVRYDGPCARIYFQCSDKDRNFLESIKNITGFSGNISESNNWADNKCYKKIRFTISSRSWYEFLKRNFRTGKIPNIPSQYINHYIRGYFDGDGSVFESSQSGHIHSNFVFGNKGFA